jgi:hypothetical protein
VYVLQGHGLTPQDPNGKADPFLLVKLGSVVKGSQQQHIPAELNPKFYAVYEFNVTFPGESLLTVRGTPYLPVLCVTRVSLCVTPRARVSSASCSMRLHFPASCGKMSASFLCCVCGRWRCGTSTCSLPMT